MMKYSFGERKKKDYLKPYKTKKTGSLVIKTKVHPLIRNIIIEMEELIEVDLE